MRSRSNLKVDLGVLGTYLGGSVIGSCHLKPIFHGEIQMWESQYVYRKRMIKYPLGPPPCLPPMYHAHYSPIGPYIILFFDLAKVKIFNILYYHLRVLSRILILVIWRKKNNWKVCNDLIFVKRLWYIVVSQVDHWLEKDYVLQ